MKILITGICGFVGSSLAVALAHSSNASGTRHQVFGIDNLSRPGSEGNRQSLRELGIDVRHGDVRVRTDIEDLPRADWLVDASAQSSVLSGTGTGNDARAVLDVNLQGTVNLLEYCRHNEAGFILLSSSRVYSIARLREIPLRIIDGSFSLGDVPADLVGLSEFGIRETFPTDSPISLYGASKLASEIIAQEYAAAFSTRVWINRCGVLAGPGQFARADQGIFSYWIHSYRWKQPLRYIGFDGTGHQARDCLHPADLADLLCRQMAADAQPESPVFNVGGGIDHAISLLQLSSWCEERFGYHPVGKDLSPRAYDVPWIAMDARRARTVFDWTPHVSLEDILGQIADFADTTPNWLERSA